mmetsp:Transcript_54064/g.128784  ORF Transcript_54064/g.128784 Transcript_54064/m.128784 type:complete len:325 (+) Transcript_54064:47-1021(+)
MINRLNDLQAAAAPPCTPPKTPSRYMSGASSSSSAALPGSAPLLVAGGVVAAASDETASQFLAQLDNIMQGPFRELKELMSESRKMHEQALKSTSVRAERDAIVKVEQCAVRISEASQRTSRALKALIEYSTSEELASSDEANLRRQSVAGTSRMFQSELQAYFQEQAAFRAKMEAKVSRQLRAAVPDADDQVIRAVIAGSQSAARAIQDTMGAQPGLGPLSHSVLVESVQDCHTDLERLEKTTVVLKQLMAEFEAIVILQGERLDDIEQQISATRVRTQAAVRHIQRSEEYRRCACKWQICILLSLILCVALVLVVTLISRAK